MKYAELTEEGFPAGFYDDQIHSSIPDGAVPITEEQWQDCLENPTMRRWNGNEFVEDKQVFVIPEDERWEAFRETRAQVLSDSDWTQLADSPLTEEERTAWAQWRIELRDIPKNFPNIDDAEQELTRLRENPPQ